MGVLAALAESVPAREALMRRLWWTFCKLAATLRTDDHGATSNWRLSRVYHLRYDPIDSSTLRATRSRTATEKDGYGR